MWEQRERWLNPEKTPVPGLARRAPQPLAG